MLKEENSAFEAMKQELFKHSPGMFVLIKGSKIHSLHNTESEAVENGYRAFGNSPFLVKQISLIDKPVDIVSNVI